MLNPKSASDGYHLNFTKADERVIYDVGCEWEAVGRSEIRSRTPAGPITAIAHSHRVTRIPLFRRWGTDTSMCWEALSDVPIMLMNYSECSRNVNCLKKCFLYEHWDTYCIILLTNIMLLFHLDVLSNIQMSN